MAKTAQFTKSDQIMHEISEDDGKYYCLDCYVDITENVLNDPNLCEDCYRKRYSAPLRIDALT